MISYEKLWNLLHERNIPKTYLVKNKVVVGQSYYNLTKGKSMTMDTLNSICRYLNCQPGDILEYIPDQTQADQPDQPQA